MNRMKQLREARGISMKQAAQQLQLPYTTYVNYEKGERQPGPEALMRIARFYNTTVDVLLGGAETAAGKAEPAGGAVTEEDIKFALFGGGPVSDAQFEEVKQFVRFIKERDAHGRNG